MRYIDIHGCKPPEGWEKRAQEALEAIKPLAPADRAKEINRRSTIWAELKPILKNLSFDKCWYCESKDLRSDNAVDHFRPKNNVKGSEHFPLAKAHPGYWWLAFDYRNYRFSCTLCNSIRKSDAGTSGGKQDYFPLWDETYRCASADGDADNEQPILLDPTNVTDVAALWFDDAGSAAPRPRRPAEPEEIYRQWEARASESIRFYHLNHPDIREARSEQVRQVRIWTENADKWLGKMDLQVAGAQVEAEHWLRELWQAAKPESQYSSAVRCVLKGMRASSPAAREVLEVL